MNYKIIWHKGALEDLKRLDISIRQKIFEKVDPIDIGKPLKQNLAGMFRYRFGDYRIIYVVNMPERSMKILAVGHRRKVYKKNNV